MKKGLRPRGWFTVLCVAGALTAAAWLSPASAVEPCTGGIGQWNWFIGGVVTLSEGGGVRWAPPKASIPPATGTWKCDPNVGEYVVTWQNGFVDTLSLSPDGSKLTGKSSTGVAVSGSRARAAGAAPAGTAPAAPTSSVTQSPTTTSKPSSSGAIDHNPSVSEILKNRPKPDPRGWKQDRSGGPQKGPKPFEGWK